MDALDLLEQQHRELAFRIAEAIAAEGAGRRTARAAQLVRAVEAHSRVEETVFYAVFTRRIGADEPRLHEAYEAHALLRFAAENLLHTRATDVRFDARLKLVHDLFERHAALEEDWMFPKAKRALSDEALDQIGDDVARAHAARLSVVPVRIERPRPRRLRHRPALAERRAAVY
jgi:hemerythrin superfamily protein